MTSLLLLSLAGIYRPYLECEGFEPKTQIEVMQNITPADGLPLYSFNMIKRSRGKFTRVRDLGADRVPTKRKQVIEVIAATNQKGVLDYELMVFNRETDDGYVAQLIDHEATTTVFCNYLITEN